MTNRNGAGYWGIMNENTDHSESEIIRQAMSIMGQRKKTMTPAAIEARRTNGAKGGRPRGSTKSRPVTSHLDPEAILCDLPDAEFETGGAITKACRAAGYDESGRAIVNQMNAWSLPVRKFLEILCNQ